MPITTSQLQQLEESIGNAAVAAARHAHTQLSAETLLPFREWCGSRGGLKDLEFYRSRVPAF